MSSGTSPTKLLLIEDDPGAAQLVTERLAHHAPGEFSVTQARSLEAGLAEASESSFQLAILDLALPDSAGVQTCNRFASQQPNVPFIVLTGISDRPMSNTLAKAGAGAVLDKADASSADIVAAARAAALTRPSDLKGPTPEATKAAAEARFRNAIIDSADGIVVLDSEGKIVLVSAGAELLLDRSAADLAGTSLGLDLVPGQPVRAQIVREESGQQWPDQEDESRRFDVSRLHLSDIEFWPFEHQWTNQRVTVCAILDVSNQAVEESRQRGMLSLEERLKITSGLPEITTEIALRLGALTKFNRFEISAWRSDLQRMQIVAQLGLECSDRDISDLVSPDQAPPGYTHWISESSGDLDGQRISIAIGRITDDPFHARDRAILARCVSMAANELRRTRMTPVLVPNRTGDTLRLAGYTGSGSLDSSLPEAA